MPEEARELQNAGTLAELITQFGLTVRLHDPDIARQLAAKVIRDGTDPSALARFMLEVQVTGQLAHPNIVPLYELGMTPERQIYFTMKQVQGRTLADLLADPEPDQQTERRLMPLLQILLKVCDALAFAHSRGVIHRDLEPAHIIVGRFGEVQLRDWGLARVVGQIDRAREGLTLDLGGAQLAELAREGGSEPLAMLDGQLMGAPHYMPPEQARGEIDQLDERADIYALGAMLYQMLAGQPPHMAATPIGSLLQLLQAPPLAPSALAPERHIPWELEAAVTRAMSPLRVDRYQTVGALRRDLEAWLEGRALRAVHYSPQRVLNNWRRRHSKPLAAAGAVLLALLALLTNFVVNQVRQRKRAEDQAELAEEKAIVAGQYKQERDAATKARRDLLHMSDLHRLAKLEKEAASLWPAHRRMIPRYRQWLTDAHRLVANLPAHRASLAPLRKQGKPLAAGGWSFASDELQWVHDNLTRLVAGLERFSGAKGCLADISQRRERARTLWQRSVEAWRDRWSAATKAIIGSKHYSGFKLGPQEGLVPIGPDPQSGLWEFVHIGSGRIPQRGAEGKLQFDGGSAIVLVLVPGGAFRMGAKQGEAGPNTDPQADRDESPVHQVKLNSFFISKYELTQSQWRRLTGHNPSRYLAGRAYGPWLVTPTHPVERVSWNDCREALLRAGLTLPSEAQWEYAARGGTLTVRWTGNANSRLAQAANLADKDYAKGFGATVFEPWSDGHTLHAPVGSYRANAFGLHDVIGNVWEWCQDRYHAKAYGLPPSSDLSGRPVFPSGWLIKQERRVSRGGAYINVTRAARSANRGAFAPSYRGDSLGCRPIRLLD